MFSLWQDRQRWPLLLCTGCLQAAWVVSNQFRIMAFYTFLQPYQTQAIPVLICAVSPGYHLSAHFSTLCVYGIEIIESYASLPLHAPYVCIPSPLSFHPPLPSLVCLRDFITTEQQSAQGSGGSAARTLEQQSFSALLRSVNLK